MERDQERSDEINDQRGKTPSTATNASWETGAGEGSVGFDSPGDESRWLSNADVAESPDRQPYYPPGGGADNEPGLHDERKH